MMMMMMMMMLGNTAQNLIKMMSHRPIKVLCA